MSGALPRRPGARRAALLVGLVVAAAALLGIGARATYGAQVTADEPQYLLSAISLADDLDLDISDELAGGAWRPFHEVDLPRQTAVRPDGSERSPHGPGLPLLLAVPVALGGWVGAKAALALVAGLLGALLVRLAATRLDVPVRAAAFVVVGFGAAAPLAVYGTQVYPELVAALLVALGLAGVLGPVRRAGTAVAVVAVVALPWFALKYVPVAAVLAVAVLWRVRGRPRSAAAVLGALALGGVAVLAGHQLLYGGWTPYAAGSTFTGGELTVVGRDPDYLGRSPRLVGLLVDRGFGLAAWQPAYLLALPALAALARRRPAGWAVLVGLVVVGWLVATYVALTMHGWWAPGRQVVVVLPALVLVVAWWVGSSGRRLAVMVALGALGVVSYAWLVVEASTGRLTMVVDFASTANPWYRVWRHVLPDYQVPDATTWALHAGWLVVAVLLVGWGWRTATGSAAAGVADRAADPVASAGR